MTACQSVVEAPRAPQVASRAYLVGRPGRRRGDRAADRIMRIFAVGSWAHFGSLVVSLAHARLRAHQRRHVHRQGLVRAPLARRRRRRRCCCSARWPSRANLLAQQVPFNAIFLVSDPAQKWRLLANFVLYLLPFLAGALFLGIVFLRSRDGVRPRLFRRPRRLGPLRARRSSAAMYCLAAGRSDRRAADRSGRSAASSGSAARRSRRGASARWRARRCWRSRRISLLPDCSASRSSPSRDYKGVAYARKFPGRRAHLPQHLAVRRSRRSTPAPTCISRPGLSDNAAFNLPELPANAYRRHVYRRRGPDGIMRNLPRRADRLFPLSCRCTIPMCCKHDADDLRGAVRRRHLDRRWRCMQRLDASVTVAESNPASCGRFRDPAHRAISPATSCTTREVNVIDYDGRLYLANTAERYDVIDLSLADSAGLSNPGGFAIAEKYAYTRRGDARLHARAAPTAASCRSRCGTRKSRRSRS